VIGVMIEYMVEYFLISNIYSNLKKKKEVISYITIILFVFSIFSDLYNYLIWGIYQGSTKGFTILSLIFTGICFLFCMLTSKTKLAYLRLQQKKDQQESENRLIKKYIYDIELQFTEGRKIRHDFHNILCSLNYYIEDGRYNELAEYYQNDIKPTIEYTAGQQLLFEKLALIKTSSLKSIVYSKLVQMSDVKVEYTLEINEEIDIIIHRPLNYVRVLGIIFDNAREEVELLKYGIVEVAIFKENKLIYIIVKNDCSKNLPNISKLKEQGFTLKPNHQGIGLFSLQGIVESSDRISLETKIENQKFTQILTIQEVYENV
jgi:two-component system sensor histidine kinase AgrC